MSIVRFGAWRFTRHAPPIATNGSSASEKIAVVLGWGGCKPKHLRRLRHFYHEHGFTTLEHYPTPLSLLRYPIHADVATDMLAWLNGQNVDSAYQVPNHHNSHQTCVVDRQKRTEDHCNCDTDSTASSPERRCVPPLQVALHGFSGANLFLGTLLQTLFASKVVSRSSPAKQQQRQKPALDCDITNSTGNISHHCNRAVCLRFVVIDSPVIVPDFDRAADSAVRALKLPAWCKAPMNLLLKLHPDASWGTDNDVKAQATDHGFWVYKHASLLPVPLRLLVGGGDTLADKADMDHAERLLTSVSRHKTIHFDNAGHCMAMRKDWDAYSCMLNDVLLSSNRGGGAGDDIAVTDLKKQTIFKFQRAKL